MKSISLLASLAAVSAICVSVACSSKSDGNAGAGGSSGGGGTSSGGDSTSGGSSAAGKTSTGGTKGEAGDTSSAAAAGAPTTSEGGDTGSGVGACGEGVLFAGDPLYNDKPDAGKPKPAGQGLLDDPPIRNEAIAVIGNKLFVETEFEIWSADLSGAAPKIARIAGAEPSGFVNAGVACKDTTFLVMRDMAAEPNGKLVVIDYVGGAVIEISDPGGPNCKSDWVAGTHAKTADPGDAYPLAQGDKDGPGAQALFGGDPNVTGVGGGGIHKVAVDPDGNIYTYDEGTKKYKMIATDAARTVSTIGMNASGDDNIMGLAFLKGKLYATGVDGSNDFLLEIDPATYKAATPKANVKEVFRNRGDQFPEISGTGHQAIPAQMVTDGQALIVSAQSGYVWRMGTDGTVLATLAGSGAFLDYQDGFDPLKAHPATDWQLVSSLSNADGGPWLALDGGKLYWSGGIGIGKYMVQFSCP